MPSLSANGLEVGFDVHGAGPPIVMLHGASSLGAEDFAAQLPLVSKAFLAYLPDARGHGRTGWDVAAKGFRYDWLVDDVEAFVDALGLATFHLLGFSMGAMTALQYAARHPERLRTAVFVGITSQREPRASVARRMMDPARIEREDPDFAARLARRHDAGQGPGAWRALLPAIAEDVLTQPLLGPAELRTIDAPTLVAVGDRDPFVPVDHAWGLMRQLPDSRLFVAPRSGHEVMARRPALFNEALASFYRTTEADARRRAEAATRPATEQASEPATEQASEPATERATEQATEHASGPATDAAWLGRAADEVPPTQG
jgi:pimeloyl-ACP methyl ester carboxylesterase